MGELCTGLKGPHKGPKITLVPIWGGGGGSNKDPEFLGGGLSERVGGEGVGGQSPKSKRF